jgi:hypothetical protein
LVIIVNIRSLVSMTALFKLHAHLTAADTNGIYEHNYIQGGPIPVQKDDASMSVSVSLGVHLDVVSIVPVGRQYGR